MARRKGGIDRDALREKLIAVAEALVLQGGQEALTARALATHIGYSLGHVYNLVEDLDELVLLVNGRTLDRLYETLQDAAEEAKPRHKVHAIAAAYLTFCAENARMWSLVLNHRLAEGNQLPEHYAARISALPVLVATELKVMFPKRSSEQIKRDVAALWSALHGLGTLEHNGRLPLIGAPGAQLLAKHLLDLTFAGMKDK